MPRMNLYISEEDKPIFDQAAEMLGEESTSAAIAAVLRREVEAKKAELEGMEEIELEIGSGTGQLGDSPDYKKVRFTGRGLAHFRQLQGNDTRGVDYDLYRSKKGKFLLYIDDWSRWQGEVSTSEYHIFETLQEVEEFGVPEGLIRDAKEEMGEDPAEELDI